jgi:choline kinase
MADHVFESWTAKVLAEQPLFPGEVLLAVDSKIDRVFDLEDATKVRREGDLIVAIGKDIFDYDALDTGMFLCTPALFERLEALWQDVDTPGALAHAEGLFVERLAS